MDDETAEDEALPDGDPAVDEPLAEEIPLVVMAAIRDRMHARRLSSDDDPGHVQESLGTADDDVHVVDDGPEHCMIGRPVGHAPDGCVYVLVARISRYDYEQLRDGDVEMTQAFSAGRDISFCAVYEVDGTVENIALVRRFRHGDDVPAEYLPPSAFLEFADEDSPDDDTAADGIPSDETPADDTGPDDTGPDATGPDAASPVNEHLLIDEDSLTDQPVRGRSLLGRAFDKATGAARRAGTGRGGGGFPPF